MKIIFENKYKIIKNLAKAFIIYFSLLAKMSSIYPNIYFQSADSGATVVILSILQRFDAILGNYTFPAELCLIFIIGFIFLTDSHILSKQKKSHPPIFCNILSAAFALLYLFGESYLETDSAVYIFGDFFLMLISTIRLIGFFLLFNLMIKLIYCGLNKIAESLPDDNAKQIKAAYPKVLSVLLLAYLPQLIIIFPGGYCNDIQSELMEYFGYLPMADPHPPLFTMMIGTCVALGNRIFHSPNLGLFLFTLIQYCFLATGLSYCIVFIYRRLQSRIFLFLSTAFFACLPIFSFYASSINKNVSYATCLLWMTLTAYEIMEIMNEKEFPLKRGILLSVRFAFFSALASLVCHNGIYISIPMSVLLILLILIKKNSIPRMKGILSPILLLGVILFFFMTKAVYPALGIEKGMDHLIYTNMLQHTCRLILTHPDELNENDISAVSRVIDYDRIPDFYNPRTSDGIKPIVNLYAPDEDVKEYVKVWRKQLTRHPFVILDASFNVSYGFLTPVARNEEHDFSTWFYESDYPEFNFHAPSRLSGLRNLYDELLETYVSLPFIRLLENPGIYFWCFLFSLCLVLNRKRYDFILYFVPGIMTSIFYLGIPAYYHHPRYAFPLMYSAMFYTALCILALKKTKEELNEK